MNQHEVFFSRSTKEYALPFIEDLKEFLASVVARMKYDNNNYLESTIGGSVGYGLTYQQKADLVLSFGTIHGERHIPCRCYSLGSNCKAHGAQYINESLPNG